MQHANVLLPLEDGAEGRRDVRGREPSGRDLVEKGLEEMKVPPVDEGDPNRGPFQRPGGVESAETAADDDDVSLVASQRQLSS